ncbi:hypothetical protein Vau01_122790 [Virgisporangium aurantiacum]|uniref:Transposase n=2 Tax=Virgisporangium aurantiacum TaxID=175570 RepID=A0A8J3ZNB2_9ACTN|nr:hypothetical protein Vau01_122790 [Virgisporangium aurantiacum]
MEIVYERVAGIDVHKRQITVAVRSPGQATMRRTQVRRFATFYAALQQMTAWLLAEGLDASDVGDDAPATGRNRADHKTSEVASLLDEALSLLADHTSNPRLITRLDLNPTGDTG